MILYFSATGNSRYVAEQLAAATGDIRLTDMRTISDGKLRFSISAGEPVGFVFPVHSWGMPKGLPELVSSLRFDGYSPESNYCYMACSCGDDAGLTFTQWMKCAGNAGLRGDAGYSVFMPNTYVLLPGFDTDDEATVTKKATGSSAEDCGNSRNDCQKRARRPHFPRQFQPF